MDYGLIGRHIAYSLSASLHGYGAKLLGKTIRYRIFDLPEVALDGFLQTFYDDGGLGLNVTSPYKESVARAVGAKLPAVNTLYRQAGGWAAANTDGPGFASAVQRLTGKSVCDFEQLVFLGSGGAVAALLSYLANPEGKEGLAAMGPRIHILRRSAQRDKCLATILPSTGLHFHSFEPRVLRALLQSFSTKTLLVQATAAPHSGELLAQWQPALEGFQGAFMDLAYRPASLLLDKALSLGLPAGDGLPMLVEQARFAQKLWWQEAAPYEALLAHLRAELKGG